MASQNPHPEYQQGESSSYNPQPSAYDSQQPAQNYQQSYPQQYGQAGGGDHPQTQTVFILGLVGIAVGICSFIAWYMGGKAKKEIAAGAPYRWGGNLKTGYLLGKIFGILYIVGIVFYVIAIIVLMMSGMPQS